MKPIKVTLREKPISGGEKKSLYLDYYPPLTDPEGKKTRREFLGLYLYTKPKDKWEREENKVAKIKAEEKRSIRQIQLYKEDFSFLHGNDTDSVEVIMQELIDEAKNRTSRRQYTILADMIKKYAGVEVLSFKMFTPEFCQGYINYLRTKKYDDNGRYPKELLERTLSQNTASNCSAAFIKFINRSESRDKLFNVSKKIKGILPDKNTKREFLTVEELKALAVAHVDRKHLRCRDACFAANTGLRKGDILNLEWDDIVVDDGKYYIHFRQEKGNKHEYFPLNTNAVKLLGERKKGKVFHGVTKGKLKYLLDYWIPAAGIKKHITMHSFRHTFASMLVKKGVNMAVIMKLMGHADIATTMRYSHLSTEEKQNAVDKLDH